jgi:hypothetical protein
MGGTRSTEGEMRNEYNIIVEKPDGKRSLGRPDVEGMVVLKWVLKKLF